MIRFYSKIRQSLLNLRNIRKYTVYALGEILLVVLGILIALQINNWNESRMNRRAESKAIEDLLQEFDKNYKNFQRAIGVHEMILNRTLYIWRLTEKDELLHSDIDSMENWTRTHTYNPSHGVLNSLISTGAIGLIQNDSLKYLLTNWKDRVEDYTEDENWNREYRDNILVPYLNNVVPIQQLNVPRGYFQPEINYSTAIRAYKDVFATLKFQNELIETVRRLHRIIRQSKPVERDFKEIMRHLRNELDKTDSHNVN